MTTQPIAAADPAAADAPTFPALRLKNGEDRRLSAGHLWVFSNEVDTAATPLNTFAKGAIARVISSRDKFLGYAYVNPNSLISARIMGRDQRYPPGRSLIVHRLLVALSLRERLYDKPFYRLVYGESDGLPGLVLDRYGDRIVGQIATAGMEAMKEDIVAAVQKVLSPKAMIWKNDSGARELEGLPSYVETAIGDMPDVLEVEENGVRFRVPSLTGQKTGWFFDQRDNRAFMASLSKGATVVDFYTHTGGFAIAAAKAGAVHVTAVDRSQHALDLAAAAATENGVADRFTVTRGEVYGVLEQAASRGETWQVVIADPPAFVKSKKDLKASLQGYRKLARLCAAATAPGGWLFIASCSHNAPLEEFSAAVARGLHDAGRAGRIVKTSGAGADHPVHPMLPESAYLKALTFALD